MPNPVVLIFDYDTRVQVRPGTDTETLELLALFTSFRNKEIFLILAI